MRNALGLMLGSVVAAVVIAGVWFWTSSPRAGQAAPQTVSARPAEPLPAAAARLAAKDDIEITAAIAAKPPVAAQPIADLVEGESPLTHRPVDDAAQPTLDLGEQEERPQLAAQLQGEVGCGDDAGDHPVSISDEDVAPAVDLLDPVKQVLIRVHLPDLARGGVGE